MLKRILPTIYILAFICCTLNLSAASHNAIETDKNITFGIKRFVKKHKKKYDRIRYKLLTEEEKIKYDTKHALIFGVGSFVLVFILPFTPVVIYGLTLAALVSVFFATRAWTRINNSSEAYIKELRKIQIASIFTMLTFVVRSVVFGA